MATVFSSIRISKEMFIKNTHFSAYLRKARLFLNSDEKEVASELLDGKPLKHVSRKNINLIWRESYYMVSIVSTGEFMKFLGQKFFTCIPFVLMFLMIGLYY